MTASTGQSSSAAPAGSASAEALLADSARSLGLGLVAGALAALPALGRGLGGEPAAALVLAGTCALPMALVAPIVLGLRRARWAGERLAEEGSRPQLLHELGGTLLLAAGPLAWLGRWIEQNTHHRPLGAVTFAVAALVGCGLAWLLVRRLLRVESRPLVWGLLGVAGAFGMYLLIGGAVAGFAVGGAWLDGVGLLAWPLVAAWLPWPFRSDARRENASGRSRLLWRAAVVTWLGVCAVAVLALVLRGSELAAHAPVFSWLAS